MTTDSRGGVGNGGKDGRLRSLVDVLLEKLAGMGNAGGINIKRENRLCFFGACLLIGEVPKAKILDLSNVARAVGCCIKDTFDAAVVYVSDDIRSHGEVDAKPVPLTADELRAEFCR